MAKPKVAPIHAAGQPAPQSHPLSSVTITWPRRHHFEGDEHRAPVVVNGLCLDQLVSFLAETRPGRLHPGPDGVWDEGEVHMALEGFSEILRVLGATDYHQLDPDFPAMLVFLAESLRDQTARLGAALNAKRRSEGAIVTIAASPAPKAEAS